MYTRFRCSLTVIAALGLASIPEFASAQEFPVQPPQPRVVRGGPVLNVEGTGTYRSVINSFRKWRAANGDVTEETVRCDVKGTFHGNRSSRVEGYIRYLRQLKHGDRIIGTTRIEGDGPLDARHELRIGLQNAANPGVEWMRWGNVNLELPVTHTVNSSEANAHTTYCEAWLKREQGTFHPLKGNYKGPLNTVNVVVKPVITSNPPGTLIELNQTVELEWDVKPFMKWPPGR